MMFTLLVALLVASGSAPVESVPDHGCSADGDWLVYDNGTPHWFTWVGSWRGVWFNIEDFIPGYPSWMVGTMEFWFYHQSNYPWDTSWFYAELWNGDSAGPGEKLGSIDMYGEHYSGVYGVFDPAIGTEADFWCIINTEMSAGGWPSNLADWAQQPIAHSFFSTETGMEPFQVKEGYSNYFIRCNPDPIGDPLSRTTWAEVKSVFQ